MDAAATATIPELSAAAKKKKATAASKAAKAEQRKAAAAQKKALPGASCSATASHTACGNRDTARVAANNGRDTRGPTASPRPARPRFIPAAGRAHSSAPGADEGGAEQGKPEHQAHSHRPPPASTVASTMPSRITSPQMSQGNQVCPAPPCPPRPRPSERVHTAARRCTLMLLPMTALIIYAGPVWRGGESRCNRGPGLSRGSPLKRYLSGTNHAEGPACRLCP